MRPVTGPCRQPWTRSASSLVPRPWRFPISAHEVGVLRGCGGPAGGYRPASRSPTEGSSNGAMVRGVDQGRGNIEQRIRCGKMWCVLMHMQVRGLDGRNGDRIGRRARVPGGSFPRKLGRVCHITASAGYLGTYKSHVAADMDGPSSPPAPGTGFATFDALSSERRFSPYVPFVCGRNLSDAFEVSSS